MDLRDVRKAKGLTQKEAAEIIGVPLESYKNHEMGRSNPSSPLGRLMLEKLCSYEPFTPDRGILPLNLLTEKVQEVVSGKNIDFVYLYGDYGASKAKAKSPVCLLLSCKPGYRLDTTIFHELEIALHKKVVLSYFGERDNDETLLREVLHHGVRIFATREGE